MKTLLKALLLLLFFGQACAAELFGTVDALRGGVHIVEAGGNLRAVSDGQEIFEGQTLATLQDGEVHIVTVDGGFLALRPNSSFRVDSYRAERNDDDKIHLSLLKGALRSISGWITKYRKDAYLLRTRTATVGIRGTDHETFEVEANTANREAGTYQTVYQGAVVLRSAHGELDVQPGKAAFVPLMREQAPRLLDDVPDFMKNRDLSLEGRITLRREELRKALDQMSEERAEKIRERMRDASPEQRERMRRRMIRKMHQRND